MLATEPPTAAARLSLHQVRGTGQPVLRRTRADGDLNVYDREVGVANAGSEVAEKDAAAVVRTLVKDQPLDAGARSLGVVERPAPLRRLTLNLEAVERIEIGRGVELPAARGRELDRHRLRAGVDAVAATAERVVGAQADAIGRIRVVHT